MYFISNNTKWKCLLFLFNNKKKNHSLYVPWHTLNNSLTSDNSRSVVIEINTAHLDVSFILQVWDVYFVVFGIPWSRQTSLLPSWNIYLNEFPGSSVAWICVVHIGHSLACNIFVKVDIIWCVMFILQMRFYPPVEFELPGTWCHRALIDIDLLIVKLWKWEVSHPSTSQRIPFDGHLSLMVMFMVVFTQTCSATVISKDDILKA